MTPSEPCPACGGPSATCECSYDEMLQCLRDRVDVLKRALREACEELRLHHEDDRCARHITDRTQMSDWRRMAAS